jgi:hypothetical protein
MINNIPPEKIEILEKEIEQALRNKKFSLKFPDELERIYHQKTIQREKEIKFFGVIAIILYNLFVVADRFMQC